MADSPNLSSVNLLLDVAHAAWHLMDDSGEIHDSDPPAYEFTVGDYTRLEMALDALEASGWEAHPEEPAVPPRCPTCTSWVKGPIDMRSRTCQDAWHR